MNINPDVQDLFGFSFEDFKLEGYEPHERIKFDIAV
jgi:thymidylate synthase